ncbi:hypothetical protein [Methylobacter sp.]|uniref:hypothetical protein n=1 Tax=Methylobacter sp. TaxID=2051955 RepID=UPI00120F967D|nr:hypothetical protein [Methylobacter sp.]TAK64006.1 MAG: hypothetical protein EPO18_04955 [Methylobacter sp.]
MPKTPMSRVQNASLLDMAVAKVRRLYKDTMIGTLEKGRWLMQFNPGLAGLNHEEEGMFNALLAGISLATKEPMVAKICLEHPCPRQAEELRNSSNVLHPSVLKLCVQLYS